MASGSDDDVIIYTDMILTGSLSISQVSELPTDAKVVTLVVKDGILYGYLNIQGVTGWCPFAKIPMNFVYRQDVPSYTWAVVHNLDAIDTWVQVKDHNGNPVLCGKDDIDSNSFTLHFTEPMSGACLVLANSSFIAS